MRWRGATKSSLIALTLFSGVILSACSLQPLTTEQQRPSLEILIGGWLLAGAHEVRTVSPQGEVSEPYPFTATVRGVLVQPVSNEALVFLEEEGTWTIWSIGIEARVVYSSKVAIDQCSLAPNGHALACIQAGDLNLIQVDSGDVERIGSEVRSVTWSPTNTDVLVGYIDRMELVGLDLADHVATTSVIYEEPVDFSQFVNTEQLVWWEQGEIEKELVLFSLRTKQRQVLRTGEEGTRLWVNGQGNRLAISNGEVCVASCLTTVISLPQGKDLEQQDGVLATGWLNQALVVKTEIEPIDQEVGQTYHFAALADASETDMGDGLFVALPNHLEVDFSH